MLDCLSPPATKVHIRLQRLIPGQTHGLFVERWRNLAHQRAYPNPFLSPDFVLPYLIHVSEDQHPMVLTGEGADGRLLGLGLFHVTAGSKTLPLPHLIPFRCRHQYRDGLLVDPAHEREFFEEMLNYLTEEQEDWYGIEFRNLQIEEHWARQLRLQAAEFGCSFRLTPKFQAPAVDLTALGDQDLESTLSSSRRKSLRRNRNRLEKWGPVEFRVQTHTRDAFRGLEKFLRLEHASWKGEQGTSLLSNPGEAQFIRDVASRFHGAQQLMVSELSVGGEVAAAALNFRVRDRFYAFKIGWNEKFAEASPGLLHEIELIRYLRQHFPGIALADSCSREDSYLSSIWKDRLTIGEGLLSVTTFARGTGKLIAKLRKLKHWASDRIRAEQAE